MGQTWLKYMVLGYKPAGRIQFPPLPSQFKRKGEKRREEKSR